MNDLAVTAISLRQKNSQTGVQICSNVFDNYRILCTIKIILMLVINLKKCLSTESKSKNAPKEQKNLFTSFTFISFQYDFDKKGTIIAQKCIY